MKKPAGILFVNTSLPGDSRYAQVPYFQNYSLLKRNESVQINVMFQDKSGFLWYGTNKGLFRFDGIQHERFTITDSLPDDHVTALAQDSLGRIWTGHKNGRLALFGRKSFPDF